MAQIDTPSHRSRWQYEQPRSAVATAEPLLDPTSPRATLRDKLARRSLAAKTGDHDNTDAVGTGNAVLVMGREKQMHLHPADADVDHGDTFLCRVTDAEADYLRRTGVK